MSGKIHSAEMPRQRDSESGKFQTAYPPERVVEALRAVEPATTQEVADELDCAYQTAYQKLRELEDEGTVASDRVGNVRVWTTEEGGE